MTNQQNTTHSSMIFTAGLALGAVLAVLLTPKNGQEVRESIKNKATDMKNNADKAASELKDNAKSSIQDAKKTLSNGKDKAENSLPPMP